MQFIHTFGSGTVLKAVLSPPGASPLVIIEGEPAPEDTSEFDLWLSDVVLPALAEQTLDHLTNIDPT